jgi:hypothetical protein
VAGNARLDPSRELVRYGHHDVHDRFHGEGHGETFYARPKGEAKFTST